jgi:aminoglycoside phosphotransferase (APT) family kinase protein
MPEQDLPERFRTILAEIESAHGFSTNDAVLLGRHSNTIIALPTAQLIVRVSGNPDAFDQVNTSVPVTRWLYGRGYPCVAPVNVQPFVAQGQVISLWRLLDAVDGPPGSGSELGHLLRSLHDQPHPPTTLIELTDPLASVARALLSSSEGLDQLDRSWLLERIEQLRRAWTELVPAQRAGLIHGDAHPNNLIRLRSGEVLLGDWDHVAHGPREWDLIQPHYMARRVARLTDEQLREFTAAYGWDVRTWSGCNTMIEIREISGLSPYIRRASHEQWARDEISHRVGTLRERDTTARWNPPKRV